MATSFLWMFAVWMACYANEPPPSKNPSGNPSSYPTPFKYILVQQALDANEASTYCQDIYGTYLASIHSSPDNQQASNLCKMTPDCANHSASTCEPWNKGCYIGLNDRANERGNSGDGWVWDDGSTFDYQHWGQGEPNEANAYELDEDCVVIFPTEHPDIEYQTYWADITCATTVPLYFLCNGVNPQTQTPTKSPTHIPSSYPTNNPSNISRYNAFNIAMNTTTYNSLSNPLSNTSDATNNPIIFSSNSTHTTSSNPCSTTLHNASIYNSTYNASNNTMDRAPTTPTHSLTPIAVPSSTPVIAPTHTALSCGDHNHGPFPFSVHSMSFDVEIPYDGTIIFDASLSTFMVSDIKAYSAANVELPSLPVILDEYQGLSLSYVSRGHYIFTIWADAWSDDTFDIRITCEMANATVTEAGGRNGQNTDVIWAPTQHMSWSSWLIAVAIIVISVLICIVLTYLLCMNAEDTKLRNPTNNRYKSHTTGKVEHTAVEIDNYIATMKVLEEIDNDTNATQLAEVNVNAVFLANRGAIQSNVELNESSVESIIESDAIMDGDGAFDSDNDIVEHFDNKYTHSRAHPAPHESSVESIIEGDGIIEDDGAFDSDNDNDIVQHIDNKYPRTRAHFAPHESSVQSIIEGDGAFDSDDDIVQQIDNKYTHTRAHPAPHESSVESTMEGGGMLDSDDNDILQDINDKYRHTRAHPHMDDEIAIEEDSDVDVLDDIEMLDGIVEAFVDVGGVVTKGEFAKH